MHKENLETFSVLAMMLWGPSNSISGIFTCALEQIIPNSLLYLLSNNPPPDDPFQQEDVVIIRDGELSDEGVPSNIGNFAIDEITPWEESGCCEMALDKKARNQQY